MLLWTMGFVSVKGQVMDPQTVSQAVSARYARAVTTGERMCCPTGYDFADLARFIPEEVLKVSYGCGTPAGLEDIRPEETVLDIGSGGGIDCFEASRRVGPKGRVIGLDMTEEMLALARRMAPIVARNLGYPSSNVEFRKGLAEAMPVDDESVDLVISNCVINLSPDKPAVFREMFRVLRPGGRFTISDIVSDRPVPQYLVHDADKWGDCLSGALQIADYLTRLREAGFLGIHAVKTVPWQVIDGIHFLSLTLTGYKLPPAPSGGARFATLTGPFSAVVDELGQEYVRGVPVAIAASRAQLLATPPYRDLFLLGSTPTPLAAGDPRLSAVRPADAPCRWRGDYALLTGPFGEAQDDDGHRYHLGHPLEVCSKTVAVLSSEAYGRHFGLYNRAGRVVSGPPAPCPPQGSCC